MSRSLSNLRKDHGNVDRLMTVFSRGLEELEAGAPDYLLFLEIPHYMTHYPDMFHHPREELMFEKILTNAPAFDFDQLRTQ